MSLLETRGSLSNSRARMRAQGSDHRYHHNHENAKNAGLREAGSSNQRITIDVNDDDDEVQVLTPRSVTQARNTRHNQGEVASPTLDGGADLELRLGSSVLHGTYLASSSQIATVWTHSTGVSRSTTIDLTSGNDDDVVPLASGKRKAVQLPSERTKDIKLTCAICMDIMKEETSTVCGHIFCRSCILGAIQTQKKCPSCRRKLTNSSIHRIYLPGR